MAQLFDLKNNTNFEPTIIPKAVTADENGTEVDTLGFSSATLWGFLDAAATGSFKLQHTDTSGSGYADVSDDEVITSDGTNDTAGVASDVVTIGYAGTKRYLRAVFTHTGNGSISAGIVLGNPYVAPTGANS